MSQIFIARQPIYDRQMAVHAYELLFRASNSDHAEITNGEQATSQLLINALLEIGLPRLVGDRPAFVNLTERFIVEGLPNAMAPEEVVLEVLEDVLPGPELLAALRRLKQAGYTIALDDFEYDDSKRPLVELADLIKLDVLDLEPRQIARHVEQLKGFDIPLLAEKVETQEQFHACQELGFDYFQGYFFCKPHLVQGENTPSCRTLILRLLARMQDPEIEFKELADLIAQDVTFSYRILRYINSAQFGTRRKIESIQSAATMIGLQRIKTWLTILAMSQVDDKPYELLLTSLIRARMCELLGEDAGLPGSSCFTTGLFSALDAITDMPLENVLASLPLADEINQALLEHAGPLGQLLGLVLAYESADWDRVDASAFGDASPQEAYLQAVEWAGELSKALLTD